MMLHGGDVKSFESYYAGEIIDFSSNINPLGFPQGVREEIIKGIDELSRYPDFKYRNMKKNISKYLRCPNDNIIFGNGSMDIIDGVIALAKRVHIFEPCFSEYEIRAKVHKKEIIRHKLDSEFRIDFDTANIDFKSGDIIILGNPNNPTGKRVKIDVIKAVYERTREKDSIVVLDETFFEFCNFDYDSIEVFKEFDWENIVIIRALTKFFALPGIRLGYGCAGENIAKIIEKNSIVWKINTLAAKLTDIIFEDKEYIEKSKSFMETERKYMIEELSKISFLSPILTDANFILIKLNKFKQDYILKTLLNSGVLIRTTNSFNNFNGEFIRVAIKKREDNMRLLQGLREIEKLDKL